jgi:hypothetical protein
MNGLEIPERDWKRWRTLRQLALERYCTKILDGLTKFHSGKDTPHQRYLKLWKYIRKHDRIIGVVFDNPRRSVAYMQIHAALSEGLITREELAEMSEQTQQLIEIWLRG